MTEQQPVEVTQADAWRRLELWLFRECNEGTRRHLWSLFGLPVEEITNHGRERYALLYVKRCLATRPTPSSDMVEAMARAIICANSGEAAADHAHQFDTANWRAAKRQAKACLVVIAEAMAAKDAELAERDATIAEPWKSFHGDLPDYDHPLRCVYESGIEYAVNLLAKELGVDDWEVCDGTEEFDGDLGGTMMNIVCAALPEDQNGDRMWPAQVRATIAEQGKQIEALREALGWVAANYENGHINHVDFRVEAKHRADAALGSAKV